MSKAQASCRTGRDDPERAFAMMREFILS